MAVTNYDPDDPKGWVMRDERTTGAGRTHVSWWKGPDSGWGTTFSSLHLDRDRFPTALDAALFPTRRAAEQAARSVYGKLPKRMTAQRLKDALEETNTRASRPPTPTRETP